MRTGGSPGRRNRARQSRGCGTRDSVVKQHLVMAAGHTPDSLAAVLRLGRAWATAASVSTTGELDWKSRRPAGTAWRGAGRCTTGSDHYRTPFGSDEAFFLGDPDKRTYGLSKNASRPLPGSPLRLRCAARGCSAGFARLAPRGKAM